mmetsp:Transcript_48560/g.128434  ORF Transcript_48560/g.128434 Transcript_48560/m.128434 type:complete len:157 (-) Transcript_48560:275-745(-)
MTQNISIICYNFYSNSHECHLMPGHYLTDMTSMHGLSSQNRYSLREYVTPRSANRHEMDRGRRCSSADRNLLEQSDKKDQRFLQCSLVVPNSNESWITSHHLGLKIEVGMCRLWANSSLFDEGQDMPTGGQLFLHLWTWNYSDWVSEYVYARRCAY